MNGMHDMERMDGVNGAECAGWSRSYEKLVRSLRQKGYEVSLFASGAEAVEYLSGKISGMTVGFGDSESMRTIGLYDALIRNNTVYDPMHCPEGEDFFSVAPKTLLTDVFFTSVNGVAETGEIVNIDGTGNRVAGSIYGHKKVYFVIGSNKITPDLDSAIWRARNVAAPQNARRHGYHTPCAAAADHCYDCKGADRICCELSIQLMKMRHMEEEVILIDEPLGL